MAKKSFHFSDEPIQVQEENEQSLELKENEQPDDTKEAEQTIILSTFKENNDDLSSSDNEDGVQEDNFMAKINNLMTRIKKFKWKKWHFVCIGFVVLCLMFLFYIIFASSNEGPVYGNRCEGIMEIERSHIDQTIEEIQKKHSDIQTISMEIACKQLKVDIVFKDKMNKKDAQVIAEEAVQVLDKHVGKTKDKGKTYSHLFGYENNVTQYEVNLFLESNDSADFPIYGTKHVQNDKFSYTYASVRDKASRDKALETLKDDE